jgi:hypothetical protein
MQASLHDNKAVKPNVLHALGWRTDVIRFNCPLAEKDEVQKQAVADAGKRLNAQVIVSPLSYTP